MIYKVSPGPKGRSLWFAAEEVPGQKPKFKMVSKDSIPANILADLEMQKPLSDQQPEYRECIFCNQPATERRFLQQEYVDLCSMHYDTKTTGEQVQKMREEGYFSIL